MFVDVKSFVVVVFRLRDGHPRHERRAPFLPPTTAPRGPRVSGHIPTCDRSHPGTPDIPFFVATGLHPFW